MTEIDEEYVKSLTPAQAAAIDARMKWLEKARPKQLLPDDPDWVILLLRAGRGFGKSLTESQAMFWEMWRCDNLIGHYVCPTLTDVLGVAFEGPAGLRAVIPAECLKGASWEQAFNKNDKKVTLSNNSIVRGFSATEEGGRLRGPQAHFGAFDELREWDKPPGNLELAFNNAMFGIRLPYPDGTQARVVCGTTPKSIPFLRKLEARKDVRLVRGSSYENLGNLSISYRNQLLSLQGTQLGKQEIMGDYMDTDESAILKRAWFRLWPKEKKLPEFQFILESYDPAGSEEDFNKKKQETDPTASIVLGIFNVNAIFNSEERKRLGLRHRYAALLLDAWTERLGFVELLERARRQHRTKWGSPGRRADIVLIEDKSSGPQMRRMLATYGVPCFPYNPGVVNKTMRCHAVSPFVQQGGFFVPESAIPSRAGQPRDWCEPFLEQVAAFAGEGSVEHDDFVDCLTQAATYLRDRNLLSAGPREEDIDIEEKRAREREEAQRIADHEKRMERARENPYG
jgi:predicted phage terminase large subunit-like protein